MEILILGVGVVIPLLLLYFYATYKERHVMP
jgi:Na+-transporting methylmalonyl-CoA/oxaloacetate decarboxylase gamma subunit